MRPVLRGLCSYSELNGTTLDLNDIATMNEAIDVEEDNKCRMMEEANRVR